MQACNNTKDSQKTDICLIIPSLNGGGMERVMSELANFYSKLGCLEVHLIILTNQQKYYQIDPKVIIYEPNFLLSNAKGLLRIFKTIHFLRSTVQRINPNFCLSFGETYNSFVILSLLFTNNRIFVSDRTSPIRNWGIFHESLRKLIYAKASGIIAQTTYAKKRIQHIIGNKNISVIGNPIRIQNENEVIEKKNVILSCGRLIKSKRFDLLIELFSKTKNDDWKLEILGEGPEEHNLRIVAKKLGLNSKVTFLGHSKNVDEVFGRAKIFAFTSNSEGFPNVIGEAFRAKLPVISYKFIAGSEDLIIDNRNGILIEEGNHKEYVEKLNLLMKNEDLCNRMGAFGFEFVKKYDIEIIGREFLNFMLR